MDLHQTNLQPNLLLFNFRLRFNPTSNFPEVNFDRTLPFSKDLSSLKTTFFSTSQGLTLISAFSWTPLRSRFLFCMNLFFDPFSLFLTRIVFFLKRYQYHQLERLHQAASYAITACLSSSRIPILLSEASSPLLRVTLIISLFHLISGLCVFQLPFLFQVWPDLE